MAKKKVALEVVEPHEESKHDKGKHKSKRPPEGRPLWTGSISFGLVNVPVQMVPGIRHTDIRFHLLHTKDHARLKRQYICPVEEKPVPNEEIQKGYELTPRQHIVMGEDELKALAPKASRAIDLLYFVHLPDIDPIYFETPYYLLPAQNADKSYSLLCRAMQETQRAAISEIVVRGKEYLAAIRPMGNVLALDTMRFPDEIVFPNQLPWKPNGHAPSDKELKAAKDLVESLNGNFEPEKLKDDYREMLMKAIERKAKGHKAVESPEEPHEKEATEVVDLMSALQKSLARAQKKAKAGAA